MQKVRKEDNVLVTKGKDRGRVGPVRKVLPSGRRTDKYGNPEDGRVIVTGVNIVKRHMRPRGAQQPGGIVERESPISWANVALVCPACQKPARVGFRMIGGDRKVRYCKRCDANID
jgi:large subunit ribosomal protein L24